MSTWGNSQKAPQSYNSTVIHALLHRIAAPWACRFPPSRWPCPRTQLRREIVQLLAWFLARNHSNSTWNESAWEFVTFSLCSNVDFTICFSPLSWHWSLSLFLYFLFFCVPVFPLIAHSSHFYGDRDLMWTHQNKWPPCPTIDSLCSIELIAWLLLCFLSKSCKQTHLF